MFFPIMTIPTLWTVAILKDIAVFVAERADSLQVQVIYTVHLLAIGTHIRSDRSVWWMGP